MWSSRTMIKKGYMTHWRIVFGDRLEIESLILQFGVSLTPTMFNCYCWPTINDCFSLSLQIFVCFHLMRSNWDPNVRMVDHLSAHSHKSPIVAEPLLIRKYFGTLLFERNGTNSELIWSETAYVFFGSKKSKLTANFKNNCLAKKNYWQQEIIFLSISSGSNK